MSIFSTLFGGSPAEPEPPSDPDDIILQALAESGVDLAHEQSLDFFLYFPDEFRARHAMKEAQRAGYEGALHDPPSEALDWLILLRRRLVPAREAIKEQRARLETLAAAHDGEFEGWDAAEDD